MELLLVSAFPSIAAVIIYAMKLHSKKPKPFVHEHIWEPWEMTYTWTRTSSYGTQSDIMDQYSRTCADCGDKQFKVYSRWKNKWM